jgi:biotin carboxyl carrier protein
MKLNLQEDINRIKELMSLTESQKIQYPLDGSRHVNSGYGWRNIGGRATKNHKGVDLRAKDANIKSPLDGKVTVSDMNHNPLCGGTIDIEHSDGYKTRFCHVQKLLVNKGDTVKQGQVVGISGGGAKDPGKGNSMGKHLHWTLMKNGVPVDPMNHLDNSVSVIDTEKNQQGFSFGNFSDYIQKVLSYIFPFMNEQFSSSVGYGVYTKRNSLVIPKKNNNVVYSPTKGKITLSNCLRLEFIFENQTYYCDYCNLTVNPQLRSGDRIDVGEKLGTIEKNDVVITFYDNRGREVGLSNFQKKEGSTSTDVSQGSTTSYPSFVQKPKSLSVNPRKQQTQLSVSPMKKQTQLSVNPKSTQTQLSVNPIR